MELLKQGVKKIQEKADLDVLKQGAEKLQNTAVDISKSCNTVLKDMKSTISNVGGKSPVAAANDEESTQKAAKKPVKKAVK